jgi:VIT1/CCC1 family predicted Fe2+/Mn2+ transporter
MERISEILFGVIMALTFTCALGIATADQAAVRTMLISALGCNLAWGIIDAGLYLFACLHERGRDAAVMRALGEAKDLAEARRVVEDEMPSPLARVLTNDQLEAVREEALQPPSSSHAELLSKPLLTMDDWLGATGVFLLCFLSTLPIALPFILFEEAKTALRVSNGIAIVMLAFCGYVLGYRSGIRPWATASAMVVFGVAMVALAIKLGG